MFSLSHGKPLDVGGIGIDQAQLPPFDAGPIDLRAWFGPQRAALPLEMEIGSGKGTFLIQQASRISGVNYVGVEYSRPFWMYAADRCRRRGLGNVRLVHAEAQMFVRNYVPDACLRQVHIYFPDPWPKKRHHKRRLIQEPFLRQLHRVLARPGAAGEAGPGGLVRIATDHEEYHAWMRQHTQRVSDLFEVLPFDAPESAGEGELVGTNFERKYRRMGRPFHALILRRR